MPAELPPDPAPQSPDPTPPTPRPLLSPMFWFQLLLGGALACYGLWNLAQNNWKSPTSFLILCVGILFLPIWIARILGGLGLLGLAIWLALHALGQLDYLLAALYAFVGFSAALDGVRDFRARRRR